MGRAIARSFKPGEYICAIYSGAQELAQLASQFICDGLRKRERCWYVAAADEGAAVCAALRRRGVKFNGEVRRGSVAILSGSDAYVVHGEFNPESTVDTFNNAIE